MSNSRDVIVRENLEKIRKSIAEAKASGSLSTGTAQFYDLLESLLRINAPLENIVKGVQDYIKHAEQNNPAVWKDIQSRGLQLIFPKIQLASAPSLGVSVAQERKTTDEFELGLIELTHVISANPTADLYVQLSAELKKQQSHTKENFKREFQDYLYKLLNSNTAMFNYLGAQSWFQQLLPPADAVRRNMAIMASVAPAPLAQSLISMRQESPSAAYVTEIKSSLQDEFKELLDFAQKRKAHPFYDGLYQRLSVNRNLSDFKSEVKFYIANELQTGADPTFVLEEVNKNLKLLAFDFDSKQLLGFAMVNPLTPRAVPRSSTAIVANMPRALPQVRLGPAVPPEVAARLASPASAIVISQVKLELDELYKMAEANRGQDFYKLIISIMSNRPRDEILKRALSAFFKTYLITNRDNVSVNRMARESWLTSYLPPQAIAEALKANPAIQQNQQDGQPLEPSSSSSFGPGNR
jgi:hypothetical protein